MANLDLRLKPQHLALNVLAYLLVIVIAVLPLPTWQAVVALIAVLGALCFLWTRPTVVVSHGEEKFADLEAKIKEVHARCGTIALKVGMKGL